MGLKGEEGLTLVEVLVVIALIGAITAVGVMSYSTMVQSYRVKGAALQIYGDMQYARMKALKEGNPCAVEFSGTTYSVKTSGNDGTWGTTDDVVQKGFDIAMDYTGVNVDSSNLTNNRAVFNPDGTASGGRVVVSNSAKTQSVCVNNSTGSVRIVDGDGC